MHQLAKQRAGNNLQESMFDSWMAGKARTMLPLCSGVMNRDVHAEERRNCRIARTGIILIRQGAQ